MSPLRRRMIEDMTIRNFGPKIDLDFDVEITGFSLAEVDILLDEVRESSPNPQESPEDDIPPVTDAGGAVTRRGDLWVLGRHRVLCGDSRQRQTFDHLLQGEDVDLVFTDPPYNVPIDGHVCGHLGQLICSMSSHNRC